MSDSADLNSLRKQIDAIDQQLQKLISDRARLAGEVAEVKQADYIAAKERGESPELVFYRPEREAQILRKVMERNEGPLDDKTIAQIFRELISACLALEQPLQVAYLGPEGTFTQAAAMIHFGHAVITEPQPTIANVFAQVEAGTCDYGVVPVENSTEGMVSHTLDNFIESSLKICGEVEMRIELHLLAHPEADTGKITRICAHQQALAQCRHWLDRNWPNVEKVAVSSNGEGARIASTDPGTVAIAGEMAADLYGLQKLASNVEDYANNSTRFLVIGRETVPASGDDKTSLIVSTRNTPGALFHLLEPFEKAGISLTRIDSRPSPTETWAYVFFMEFEGHLDDPKVKEIMTALQDKSVLLKPLGSYPRAVI